jgi:hypothetical protein
MSKRHVKVNDFDGAVTSILKEWSSDVLEQTNEAVRDVATEARNELKVEGDFQNRSGKYRKGWRVTFTELRYGLEATVHNKVYQLTHLLESGHAKWLWGRDTGETVKAYPHIEKVNEEAQRKLEEEIKRRLQ